ELSWRAPHVVIGGNNSATGAGRAAETFILTQIFRAIPSVLARAGRASAVAAFHMRRMEGGASRVPSVFYASRLEDLPQRFIALPFQFLKLGIGRTRFHRWAYCFLPPIISAAVSIQFFSSASDARSDSGNSISGPNWRSHVARHSR